MYESTTILLYAYIASFVNYLLKFYVLFTVHLDTSV